MGEKGEKYEYRSFDEYIKKFYPKLEKSQALESEDAHDLGVSLARRALNKVFSIEDRK